MQKAIMRASDKYVAQPAKHYFKMKHFATEKAH